MSDAREMAMLEAASSAAFSTEAEHFARLAGRQALSGARWRLSASQWGAIGALLCRHAAAPDVEEKLKAYFEDRLKRAESRESANDQAAFRWLEGRLEEITGEAGEIFKGASAGYKLLWGEHFPEKEFRALLRRKAIVFVMSRLIRLARLREDDTVLNAELMGQLRVWIGGDDDVREAQ